MNLACLKVNNKVMLSVQKNMYMKLLYIREQGVSKAVGL